MGPSDYKKPQVGIREGVIHFLALYNHNIYTELAQLHTLKYNESFFDKAIG